MAAKRGDFDGDGKAEIPVSSPWGVGLLKLSGATLTSPIMAPNGTRFGGWLLNTADNRFDLIGDFDGDGKTDVAVYRPSTGIWYLWNSSTSSPSFLQWGLPEP